MNPYETGWIERPVVCCDACMTSYTISEARELAIAEKVYREDETLRGVRLRCDVQTCKNLIFYPGHPDEDDPLSELVPAPSYLEAWPKTSRRSDVMFEQPSALARFAPWALVMIVSAFCAVLASMLAHWLGWW